MKKAQIIYEDLKKNSIDQDTEFNFKASAGRLRQHTYFSLHHKTTVAQKDSNQLIDKLISFVVAGAETYEIDW